MGAIRDSHILSDRIVVHYNLLERKKTCSRSILPPLPSSFESLASLHSRHVFFWQVYRWADELMDRHILNASKPEGNIFA